MRRRRASSSKSRSVGSLDHNEQYVMGQGAKYLLGLLHKHPEINYNTLTFALWVLGENRDSFLAAIEKILPVSKRPLFKEALEDCLDVDDMARSVHPQIRNNSRLVGQVHSLLQRHLQTRQAWITDAQESEIGKNTRQFQNLFALSDRELDLCLLCFLIDNWEPFRNFFSGSLNVADYSGRKYLLAALNIDSSVLETLLGGNLKRMGILQRNQFELGFDADFMTLFVNPDNPMLADRLYRKAPQSALPLEYQQLPEDKVKFILDLLEEAQDKPTHILLFGPAGTGKTSLARSLAEALADPVYEILHDDNNTTAKRRAAIVSCLNMTNVGRGSVLIIDEADKLLNTASGFFTHGEVQDKGWLNTFMEQPRVRAIWIVNRHEDIEASVVRRFAFSLSLPPFSRKQRLQLWQTILRRHGVAIETENIQQLAEEYEVNAGVVETAVSQAQKTAKTAPNGRFLEHVQMVLDAYLQVENDGVRPKRAGRLDTHFSLEGLNISGDLPGAMQQLRRFCQLAGAADGEKAGRVRQLNLLFYGPPGTGKSELAKYMAWELDRDLMSRRASDLLAPWVGMTERSIARMFAEAEHREAILVVDEADSFIFGRAMAQHSWEMTHVNEFLTQMEAFQGILICTTNQFLRLDEASVRRFNHKFQFHFLTPQGVHSLYDRMLRPLVGAALDSASAARLGTLTRLTPGDFKNVRDRYSLAETAPQHTALVDALQEEERIKKEQRGEKIIGF